MPKLAKIGHSAVDPDADADFDLFLNLADAPHELLASVGKALLYFASRENRL